MESKQLAKRKSTHQPRDMAKARARRKLRTPAYLHRKLQVSNPQDKEEREADAVANEVKRNTAPQPEEEQTSAALTIARQTGEMEEEEAAQTKLSRQAEEEEEIQTKLQRQTEEEEEEAQTKLWRQPAEEEEELQAKLQRQSEEEEEEVQAKLWRQPAEEEEELQTKLWRQPAEEETEPEEEETSADLLEQRIQESRGNGSPLPDTVLKDMEQQFGRDFSHVVIHNDNKAAEFCKELKARAFTIGNDIYFASGEFSPETEGGRELLAHELTHVVQQRRHVHRKIYRAVSPSVDQGQGDPATSGAYRSLITVDIPPPKNQHSATYQSWASAGRLSRPAGRRVPRRTAQVRNWNNSIDVTEQKVRDKLVDEGVTPPNATDPNSKVALTINGRQKLEKTIPQLISLLRRPTWDRRGSRRRFQVDHMVEYQAASQDPAVDTLANYELFDPYLNRSSGGSLMVAIRRNVQNYLSTIEPAKSRQGQQPKATWAEAGTWLAGHEITFEHARSTGSVDSVEVGSWSVNDIETIKPLDGAREAPRPQKGSPSVFVLSSPGGGFQLARISHGSRTTFSTPARHRRAIAGLRLGQIALNGNEGSASSGTAIGTIEATYDLPEAWSSPETPLQLPLLSTGEYIGAPSQVPPLNLDFRDLSAVNFPSVEITPEGLQAEGQLTPSLDLFNAPITVSLTGDDLRFTVSYSSGELSLPIPGITIDDAVANLFYSSRDGFGASGMIFFSLPRLGAGDLTLSASQREGFSAAGKFNFDSNLFDTAEISVWYRQGAFGGEGTLEINQPDKIKGIQSARITASFEEEAFSAEGDVQPDIPSIQQAGLTVAYSEEEGLTIGGNLQLAANPAIRSGSIDVTVNKQGDQWRVSATGTAQPAIPNIDSELTVSYDDGAFTAEFSGAYQRGMLSGRVTVGATNRAVGEDGRPSGEPLPDGALNIYGSGSATIQIAPWLQGTAGIRFDPNGEVTVSGEIGIPNELEIFARREINKSILNIAVQAPIVPGIVAEIGGGLTAVAGIGPGVIDELSIGITYNPAHEEDTRVTGDAHLRVPADAGLRLSVRAGIGLGITGASATGGLEIGGTLGIEGAAEAGVHIDWTPSEGLDLTANLSVHAQPSFTFDISGYVSVRALGVSVYDERYQFASYTFGSDYRFGISLPVHYHEGEPFDISLDDVEFEVPNIDTNSLLRGLIGRIA